MAAQNVISNNNFDKDIPLLRHIGVECFDLFTKEELAFLTDRKHEGKNWNNQLAGHIKREHEVFNWPKEFEQKILDGCRYSDVVTNEIQKFPVNITGSPLKLGALWVNYMAKHEFNPLHKHDGVLSFIIFIKIPYSLKAEEAVFDANGRDTSKLQFLTTSPIGDIVATHANVDQSYENKMLVFNSRLNHIVYPFYTSDDYRITVSGNFAFDNVSK
tara:strand:+ start:252 stop:896 length:645 start_codon:yes stop_codon:yes gene_type:complete